MTTCENICRVCSSPAQYNIFEKIPSYLHGSPNEFLNYQKPINILLEETTGLNNSPEDGLPLHICALCISYLKHAVTFREQCIKNALSLKLVALYQQQSKGRINIKSVSDKESALITADQLRYVQRPVDNLLLNNHSAHLETTDKVHKKLINQVATQRGNNRTDEERIRCLSEFLYKQRNQTQARMELPSTSGGTGSGNGTAEDEDYAAVSSSDDNEENALSRKDKNCYNYTETNFEEDDPMEQDQLRDIKVTIPKPKWKEHKCPACSKRYMHEDTHKNHLDNCVEYQFVSFIGEVTMLLEIRQQKMVSPHEFIRRMIFAFCKTCNWLQDHAVDTQLADKLNKVKLGKGVAEVPPETAEKAQASNWNTLLSPSKLDEPSNSSLYQFNRGSTTPITVMNNVLYAIERSESRNSQQTPHPVVMKPIPIRCSAAAAQTVPAPPVLHERATFLQKLQRATVTPKHQQQQQSPVSVASAKLLPISAARCNQCNLLFDSVSELELHNGKHHNGQSSAKDDDAERRRIIALFEEDI
ncbi:uncharacterized protein LOC108601165 [Drosophila busckii]|uniref:uncharacterized protein LOC108601165 n=1 Tax=Drosophila busckii TaxID=30019 RepID=UPI001433315A|nr:uncharacterized protein LOC108601165 [Drosophila busckii]